MTRGSRRSGTSVSISNWTTQLDPPQVLRSSDTTGLSARDVVLISGRLISGSQGNSEVAISIEPTLVDRKLAIRELNGQLQGRTTKSNTSSHRS
jgi:hypothetical protein